jgi:hypothetical protein
VDREIMGLLMGVLPIAIAVLFVGASYFIITLDRMRDNSPSKDDTQVGIKLVLWAFIIAGIGMAAGGIYALLYFALSGFGGGFGAIRGSLAPLVVGSGVVVFFGLVLLPKTNNATMKQAERYAFGMLGFSYGIQAVYEMLQVINGVFVSASWAGISGGLTGVLVHGSIGFVAIIMLGSKSGWTGPSPPQRMMQMPGQGGGQPPPQQGYPPQGGGYPPQGGGYGGGGGYPQGGGGGYPQGGGGGYPPQGGGYGGGGGYPPPA